MKITERTSAVQALYDNGSYHEAFKLAMEYSKNATDDKENITLFCLLTNSYLNLLDPTEGKELDEMYKDSYITTFSTARSVNDVWEIRESLWTAFNIWQINGYKEMMDFICGNPITDNVALYGRMHLDSLGKKIKLMMLYGKHPFEQMFMKKNNLSTDEYDEQHTSYGSHKITDDFRATLQIDTAAKILFNIKEKVCKESDSDLHNVIDLVNYSVEALVSASNLATFSIDKCSNEIQCKGYKLRVEINRYLLETYVYPDGQKMSLYQNKRQILLDWIQECYDSLAKLDPEFVPLELPSYEVIYYKDIAPQEESVSTSSSEKTSSDNSSQETNKSSGGCYVATAVYGSYDCPQVWTLRRFRDYTLSKTWYGRAFVRTYYAISPTLVKWFGDTEWFKKMWKGTLDSIVRNLNSDGVENTPYEDKIW